MTELLWHQAADFSNSLVCYYNCRLLKSGKFVDEDLWVDKGTVVDPIRVFYDHRRMPDYRINCEQLILAPGFIDVQVNGGFGIDLSYNCSNLAKQLDSLSKRLPRFGVTAFCPTLVSCQSAFYHKALAAYQRRPGSKDGAAVLGLHLEGPFISKQKSGAHVPDNIIDGFKNGYVTLTEVYGPDLKQVCNVTLAPELENAMTVIKELSDKGIRVSMGHTMASLNDGQQAMANGLTGITHLFNAMKPFHHRDPCLPGLLTSRNYAQLYYGIIADLTHCRAEILSFAYRSCPEGMMLVTDAIPALGLDEGTHHLGGISYEIKNGKAIVANTNTLVGGSVFPKINVQVRSFKSFSITPINECIRNLVKATGCTREHALNCASLHPAQFLGLKDKGLLQPKFDADFVILDDDINVKATFIGGNCTHTCAN